MGKHILIIDDSAQVRDFLGAVLENEGFQVMKAAGFEEAEPLLRSARPDLALIDVVMPGVSGFEACQRVRDMFKSDPPKVIVMTGKLDAIDPIKARKMGADDFAVKTTGMEAILKSVKNLLK